MPDGPDFLRGNGEIYRLICITFTKRNEAQLQFSKSGPSDLAPKGGDAEGRGGAFPRLKGGCMVFIKY